jgi:hypothetical protein
MRLTDLKPQFKTKFGGEVATLEEADAIEFDCPLCHKNGTEHRVWAGFQQKFAERQPAWHVTGTGFGDLSFIDTPRGSRSIRYLAGCKVHLFITNGDVTHD